MERLSNFGLGSLFFEEKLMDNILHLETGILQVNTYIIVLNEKEAAVIDPGGNADEITALLKKHNLDLKAVVLTHSHFDHIGGADGLLKAFPQCKFYAHKAEAAYLGDNLKQKQCSAFGGGGFDFYIMQSLPESVRGPDVLLEGGETLFEDSLNFKGGFAVLHTPGHSAGSICLYCAAAGLLISGDTMFAGSCGRTDLTGGSEKEMKESLKRLSTLPKATQVLPGHGGTTTIADFPFGYFA